MATKKKKRSQAPVALVYFTTLLIFMGLFGFIAYRLVDKMNEEKGTASQEETPKIDKNFNLLIARHATNGRLGEAVLLCFVPDEDTVVIVPITKKTIDPENGKNFGEIYDEGGTKKLEIAVEETFDIGVDHYVTVSNANFESVCNIFGGMIFIPQEEIYYLGRDNEDDISYRMGREVELDGKQIRQLLQAEKVFSGGEKAVIDFLGEALYQMTTNAFEQAAVTRNALDNVYYLLTSDGDNDYIKTDYRADKAYLIEMLDRRISPAKLKLPDGTWDDNGNFRVAKTYINELKETIHNAGGSISASLILDSNEDSSEGV